MKNLFREVDIRMHMVIVYVVEEIAGPAIFNNLKGGKMKKKDSFPYRYRYSIGQYFYYLQCFGERSTTV